MQVVAEVATGEGATAEEGGEAQRGFCWGDSGVRASTLTPAPQRLALQ